jgi:hypothetical protein
MSTIIVQIHTEGVADARAVEIAEELTIEELLKKAFPGEHEEMIFLVEESGTAEHQRHHHLGEAGIRHGHHVHARRKVRIHVNGEPKIVKGPKVTFDEIVRLAFPKVESDTVGYKVMFTHGPEGHREGSLAKHQSVNVCNGMRFDVQHTHKS